MSFQLKPSSMIAPQPEKVFKLTLSRLGEGGPPPPLVSILNNLKTVYIRTLKFLHFFNIIVVNEFCQNSFFDAYCRAENGQSAGRCLKTQKWFITFLSIKRQGLDLYI